MESLYCLIGFTVFWVLVLAMFTSFVIFPTIDLLREMFYKWNIVHLWRFYVLRRIIPTSTIRELYRIYGNNKRFKFQASRYRLRNIKKARK